MVSQAPDHKVPQDFIDEAGRCESQPALGQTVRTLREREDDLTPQALAERADVDLRLLEQIEAGEGGDFNAITYLRRALGVTAREFAELYTEFAREEEGSESGGRPSNF